MLIKTTLCGEEVLNREGDEEGRVIVGSSFVNEASHEGRTDYWTSGESGDAEKRGLC
jgi:hypothetical protein